MIASLRGKIFEVGINSAIIEVAGVGYSVRMSTKDLGQLHTGKETRILTTMVLSQDAIALYGFLHKSTQELFTQLQKTSGIGPKVALAILSTLSAEELAQAIHDKDVDALTRAPGLGKKGAQKIIVELNGSLDLDALIQTGDRAGNAGNTLSSQRNPFVQQVIDGLVSLGWQSKDAIIAVNQTVEDMNISADIDAEQVPLVLRQALHHLDRGR